MSLSVQSGGSSASHAVGTYTGTGSDKQLTFDAPVKAMIIRATSTPSLPSGNKNTICWIIGDKGWRPTAGSEVISSISVTLSGNSITIPSSFSTNNEVYHYIAFF